MCLPHWYFAFSGKRNHGKNKQADRLQLLAYKASGAVTLVNDAKIELTVWQRPVNAIQPGDAFTVRAGCPHTFSACQSKFSNGVNFRGFPHMPGNDFVLGYAVTGETDNDGSAIVG